MCPAALCTWDHTFGSVLIDWKLSTVYQSVEGDRMHNVSCTLGDTLQ
jgi:hypothetical protein